jgi:hypothetical protein
VKRIEQSAAIVEEIELPDERDDFARFVTERPSC